MEGRGYTKKSLGRTYAPMNTKPNLSGFHRGEIAGCPNNRMPSTMQRSRNGCATKWPGRRF